MAIRFSTDELRLFARKCSQVDRSAKASLRLGVRAAGELVAADARKKADAIPGKNRTGRIAASINVTLAGATAVITAGGDAAPEAAPLENKGASGTFRHPVYGRKTTWVSQKAHPFLHPALLENADAAANLIQDAVVDGIAEVIL